jgi:hypothetical protein
VGILKQKQLGREKMRSEPSSPVSLVVKLNLGDEIQPKWGRFVTSQFSSLLKEMQNNTLVPSPLSKSGIFSR